MDDMLASGKAGRRELENRIEVSVIMPAYNAAAYITEAVDSVFLQQVNWELLIIDDGSTDNTEEVVKSYLSDSRVTYIRNKKNLGVATSRNLGVQKAKGYYIAFLDADDRWTEEKLERQLCLMKEKNAVLCSTARALMSNEGELTGRIIPVAEEITYRSLLHGNCISLSSAVIKREVALEFPMEQDRLHEDYILWLSVLKKYKIAYGLNAPMLEYRLSEKSKSGNKFKSARMTFGVYRYMGMNIFQSCYYFFFYAINGVLKYYGAG